MSDDSPSPLHGLDPSTELIAHRIFEYVLDRIRMSPPPLDGPLTAAELHEATGEMITDSGLGYDRTFELFSDVLAPACISSDHPRYLAFVPTAPSEAATLFDLVVSASSIYGDWWLEGAGAIHAENETLRWMGRLAGLPDGAGGAFVSGGTSGNLAALTTARETWRRQRGRERPIAVACAASAHSSIRLTTMVLDVPIVPVAADERGRLTETALRATVEQARTDGTDIFAVVGTGGATNTGIVDDLVGAGRVAGEIGAWFHVDAAYGGAALVSTIGRPLLNGIEQCDSFVVDPHKWLFAPFDCCALVYRDPALAGAALTQRAEYLETLDATVEWNPSDFALHMTRRVRGLPLWFSLAAHGVGAYDRAVSRGIELADVAARMIDDHPDLDLVLEPELSVVLFRRIGWAADDYQAWSDKALADGLALVVPTVHEGETLLRFCFVNPTTTEADISEILAAM